jgi:hypothetical protein
MENDIETLNNLMANIINNHENHCGDELVKINDTLLSKLIDIKTKIKKENQKKKMVIELKKIIKNICHNANDDIKIIDDIFEKIEVTNESYESMDYLRKISVSVHFHYFKFSYSEDGPCDDTSTFIHIVSYDPNIKNKIIDDIELECYNWNNDDDLHAIYEFIRKSMPVNMYSSNQIDFLNNVITGLFDLSWKKIMKSDNRTFFAKWRYAS